MPATGCIASGASPRSSPAVLSTVTQSTDSSPIRLRPSSAAPPLSRHPRARPAEAAELTAHQLSVPLAACLLRGAVGRLPLLDQALGGAGEPGLDDELLKLGAGDLVEQDEDRRVAVEMRNGEVDVRVGRDERFLDTEFGNP